MGFWGSLWSGIKSVCSAVVTPIKVVYNAVSEPIKKVCSAVYNNVIKPVGNFISKATDYVAKGIQLITRPITWAMDNIVNPVKTWFMQETFIGRGIQSGLNYISQKYEQGKKWFFQKTYIGRMVKRGYQYIRDQTVIGKACRWAGQKVGQFKQWFDSTPIGRVATALQPLVPIATLALGGIGGLAGNIFEGTVKVLNVIDNPTQLIPNYINKVQNMPIVQKAMSNPTFKQAQQKFDVLKGKISSTTNFVKQNVNKVIDQGKSILDKTKNLIKNHPITQSVISKYNKVGQFYNNSIRVNPLVGKTIQKTRQYTSTIKGKIKDQIKNVNKKVNDMQKTIQIQKNILKSFDNQEHIKVAQKVIDKNVSKILINQKPQKGVDSFKCFTSYIKKLDTEQNFNKTFSFVKPSCTNKQKFSSVFLNEQSVGLKEQKPQSPNLCQLINTDKIKLESLEFDHISNKQYSIEGKMSLYNNTDEEQHFQIQSGQLFGCKIPDTSQHTVCRQLKGKLLPKQKSNFILQTFCGDSSLHWPHNDQNFSLTNMLLNGFDSKTTLQDETWNKTNGYY